MTCSSRDVYENTIVSTCPDGNRGFIAPYSLSSSANAISGGRLNFGILSSDYDEQPECLQTATAVFASSPNRLSIDANAFDDQQAAYLDRAADTPIQPEDLSAEQTSQLTSQPVAKDNFTVAVETFKNPPLTNKQQENFIYKGVSGGRADGNLGKFNTPSNGVYVAQSRRSNARETFVKPEQRLFRGDEILNREAFLDTREEQEKSNAVALCVIAVCCILFTAVVLMCFWKNNCACSVASQPVQKQLGAWSNTPALTGGFSNSAPSIKSSTATTKLSGGHIF